MQNKTLQIIFTWFVLNKNPKLSGPEQASLHKLQVARQSIKIKPADKNLGVVFMDTDHHVTQCMIHLSDTRLATKYPTEQIQRHLSNVILSFKHQLESYDKQLYKYLHQTPRNFRILRFYGLPKIHKEFKHLPPLRPVLPLLSPSAQFVDHVLQPLARSYPDYLHNFTALLLTLQDMHVPDDAILVAVDVSNLYPFILQTECLNRIYNVTQTQASTFRP